MITWLRWIFQSHSFDLPACMNTLIANCAVRSSYRSRTSSSAVILGTQESSNWKSQMETSIPTTAHNRRFVFFYCSWMCQIVQNNHSNFVDIGCCPLHFFVASCFRYSLELLFKGRISGISTFIHTEHVLFLVFSELYFTLEFAFFLFLSSFHLFDIAMGTDPLSSHIATGCQAVITVTSSLPTIPSGPVLCRGC